jgi:hypothetical protein
MKNEETRAEKECSCFSFSVLRSPFFMLHFPAVCFLFVAGCQDLNRGGSRATPVTDPLLGGPALRASVPPAPPPTATAGAVPPLPAPALGSSNAALAAGTPRPSDPSRELRIAGPSSDGWSKQGQPAPGPAGSVVLGRPEQPATLASGQNALAATAPVSRNSVQITTREQGEAAVVARGALWNRLDQDPDTGVWRFRCSMPSPQDPRLHRTYDAKASDPISAIRLVIAQIDQDRDGKAALPR